MWLICKKKLYSIYFTSIVFVLNYIFSLYNLNLLLILYVIYIESLLVDAFVVARCLRDINVFACSDI